MYFVPAFAGLYAPYWRDDARGTIVGLTAYNNRSHIVRAALEATAFQIREASSYIDNGAVLSSVICIHEYVDSDTPCCYEEESSYYLDILDVVELIRCLLSGHRSNES